jgi:hypothetical protein
VNEISRATYEVARHMEAKGLEPDNGLQTSIYAAETEPDDVRQITSQVPVSPKLIDEQASKIRTMGRGTLDRKGHSNNCTAVVPVPIDLLELAANWSELPITTQELLLSMIRSALGQSRNKEKRSE